MRRAVHFAPAILTAVLLGAWFSLPREKLVPFSADFERAGWLLTGDEPAYLLTAQAIAAGDGQDLRNVNTRAAYTNFQTGPIIGETQWTWAFYRELETFRFWIDRSEAWGDRQTLHRPPLVSAMAAPFAFAAKRVRWKVCLLQSLLVAVGAGVVLGLLAPAATAWHWASAAAAVALLGGLPAAPYTCQVYPETLTGLFLLLALALVCRPRAWARCLGYVFLFSSLWGTARVGLGVFAAAGVLLVDAVRRRRAVDVAVLVLAGACYFGHNLALWGYPIPPNADTTSHLSVSGIPAGLLANFFSNAVGLLFLSPVSFAGLAAFAFLVFRRPRHTDTWAAAALYGGVLLVVAAFPNYRAGRCPAGRYQVIQCYLLLFPLLRAFAVLGRADRRRLLFCMVLLSVPSVIEACLVVAWPNCWFETYLPVFKYPRLNGWFGILPDVHGGRWFPQLPIWAGLFVLTLLVPEAQRLIGSGRGHAVVVGGDACGSAGVGDGGNRGQVPREGSHAVHQAGPSSCPRVWRPGSRVRCGPRR